MELIEYSLGYDKSHHLEIKNKVENKMLYFDIRVNIIGTKVMIDCVGIAKNSKRIYTYIEPMSNKYRIYKGEELTRVLRCDILNNVPKEVLQFSIDYVYNMISKDDEWLK